jgi:hypothetical protein
MEVVMRLRKEIAAALRGGDMSAPGLSELNTLLARFRYQPIPQHPGTSDPDLQRYFTIPGVSPADADRLVAELLELEPVEAAYPQPPGSPA